MIPEYLHAISFDEMIRIDLAFEGSWSDTVREIWNPQSGFLGLPKTLQSHAEFKPSIELYFQGYWIGIHCFDRVNGKNILDKPFALKLIRFVEDKRNSTRTT